MRNTTINNLSELKKLEIESLFNKKDNLENIDNLDNDISKLKFAIINGQVDNVKIYSRALKHLNNKDLFEIFLYVFLNENLESRHLILENIKAFGKIKIDGIKQAINPEYAKHVFKCLNQEFIINPLFMACLANDETSFDLLYSESLFYAMDAYNFLKKNSRVDSLKIILKKDFQNRKDQKNKYKYKYINQFIGDKNTFPSISIDNWIQIIDIIKEDQDLKERALCSLLSNILYNECKDTVAQEALNKFDRLVVNESGNFHEKCAQIHSKYQDDVNISSIISGKELVASNIVTNNRFNEYAITCISDSSSSNDDDFLEENESIDNLDIILRNITSYILFISFIIVGLSFISPFFAQLGILSFLVSMNLSLLGFLSLTIFVLFIFLNLISYSVSSNNFTADIYKNYLASYNNNLHFITNLFFKFFVLPFVIIARSAFVREINVYNPIIIMLKFFVIPYNFLSSINFFSVNSNDINTGCLDVVDYEKQNQDYGKENQVSFEKK